MEETSRKVTINISTTTLLKIILVGLLLVALYVIRDIVLMLLVSMVLASAMDPLVDWLYRRARFPRGLSVILVYLLFIAVIASVIYFLVPAMVDQFRELGGRLGTIQQQVAQGQTLFSRALNQLGVPEGLSALSQTFTDITGNFFRTTVGVFSGLLQTIAVLAITFYLISSEHGMKNFIKSLVPLKHKPYAVNLTDKVQKKIGRWLLGQLILSTFIFVLTFVGLTLLGVKFALPLALLAGVLEIVPYLGPLLSAIPAVFVAFVQAPSLALFVVILYIIIQETENYVLVPKIMGKTVGANPVVILLAVLIGFKIAGIIGMLLAVPVVAAVMVLVSDLRAPAEKA